VSEHIANLLTFLGEANTPFHAVDAMRRRLEAANFMKWQPGSPTESGKGYFYTRNDSSLIAFRAGAQSPIPQSLRLVGAHTDSPNLAVKPIPVKQRSGLVQLGVDVYGGALLNPWFDRDLSMAGRISFVDADGKMASALIDVQRPVAVIPSLAIHLDREANQNRSVNPQKDILPIVAMIDADSAFDFPAFLAAQYAAQYPGVGEIRVLDYEMSLYDTQAPALVGIDSRFIASARLDNLLSCYAGLAALIGSDGRHWNLLVCNDHEEVGSASAVGAQGPMLLDVIESLSGGGDDGRRLRAEALMLSVDNAHAVHPNFSDKHDDSHGPELNRGPVIKINRNQRYATSGEGAAMLKLLAERCEVPVQSFVMRSDLGCGSTIGPITASETGIATIDLGVPTLAMHSVRELAGADDIAHLHQLLTGFYNRVV